MALVSAVWPRPRSPTNWPSRTCTLPRTVTVLGRPSIFKAFEAVVVVVDVLCFGGNAPVSGVKDHQVGIGAHRDGSLARKESEELCRARAGGVDEAMQVEAPGLTP